MTPPSPWICWNHDLMVRAASAPDLAQAIEHYVEFYPRFQLAHEVEGYERSRAEAERVMDGWVVRHLSGPTTAATVMRPLLTTRRAGSPNKEQP